MNTEDREVRAARNESLFRGLNETLERVRAGGVNDERTDYFCECAQRSCASFVPLSPEQYEHVRSGSDRFLVLPRHIEPDIERLVEDHGSYWIVEKLGIGMYVADALDPRS
jgi:hypothetical protein